MNNEQVVIALDVGGSSVKSGIVDTAYQVYGWRTDPIDSQADAETIIGTLEHIIRLHMAAVGQHNCRGIAFGFPGPADYEAGIVRIHGLQKYESIYGMNIRTVLAGRLAFPVESILLRNDAEAAAVGEARLGAGKDYRRVIGITLGTGLGSSHLIDGRPQERGPGVPVEGWLGAVPYRGELADDWFSTRGLLRRLESVAGSASGGVASLSEQARAGDVALAAAFAEFGTDLGDFLRPYVDEFEAGAVVALGGITAAMDLFGPSLRSALSVPVLLGELGADAPLVGAADLIYSRG